MNYHCTDKRTSLDKKKTATVSQNSEHMEIRHRTMMLVANCGYASGVDQKTWNGTNKGWIRGDQTIP